MTATTSACFQTFASQAVLSLENLALAHHRPAQPAHPGRAENCLRGTGQPDSEEVTDRRLVRNQHPLPLAAKEVGGDFYDFLHLPGRRLAVLIGDVSGKGVTAAFHMAQMKGIFHALMQGNPLATNERDRFPVPSRFMAQANAALAHCLERSSFITSSLYIIDYEQGGFVLCPRRALPHALLPRLREEVLLLRVDGPGPGHSSATTATRSTSRTSSTTTAPAT
ncbi:MAG: SpoIIE family protein phosphatase [Hymenobacter sp.]